MVLDGAACDVTLRWDITDPHSFTGIFSIPVIGSFGLDAVISQQFAVNDLGLPQNPSGSVIVPIRPTRILDTRTAIGVQGLSPLGTSPIRLQVAGRNGIPAEATGVIVNLTVTSPTAVGYITTWPSDEPMPVVSNINFLVGETIANMNTLALGNNGALNVFNNAGTTHVIVDVIAWLGPQADAGTRFIPIIPERTADTRAYGGYPALPVQAGQEAIFTSGDLAANLGGVRAALINITVVEPSADTYLSVYNSFRSRPNASTINVARGQTRANIPIVEIGPGSSFAVFNANGTANVIIDVIGYFQEATYANGQHGKIIVLSPSRFSDTRVTKDPFPGRDYDGYRFSKTLDSNNRVGGIIFNTTVTNPKSAGYMTMFPWDVNEIPYVSTSNFVTAQTVANQAWVRLAPGPDNYVGVWNGGPGQFDLILDVQAVFLE